MDNIIKFFAFLVAFGLLGLILTFGFVFLATIIAILVVIFAFKKVKLAIFASKTSSFNGNFADYSKNPASFFRKKGFKAENSSKTYSDAEYTIVKSQKLDKF